MGELEGKVAVITGAGSGMGKASVRVFVREGARGVIAADISGAEKDTAAEVGGAVVPVHCDVSNEEDVIGMIDAAVQEFGRVDAVLNVAGIVFSKPMLDITRSEYDRAMDVMLRGVFLGTVHGIRAMIRTGGGAVVNWSSLAGLLPAHRGAAVYAAAKAGVISFTKAAAVDYADQGVRANAICPGFILSEIMGKGILDHLDVIAAKVPMGRPGRTDEVAELAAFLCSDRAPYINGAVIQVDGAYSCLTA